MQFSENPNKDLIIKVHKLTFLLDRVAEYVLREGMDLTFTHYRFLRMLKRSGTFSQQDLASFCGLTPAAVSRLVGILAVRGLVSRTTNLVDRRKRVLSITEKGKLQADRAHKLLDAKFADVFKILPAKEKEAFRNSLDRLLQAVWEEGRPHAMHAQVGDERK